MGGCFFAPLERLDKKKNISLYALYIAIKNSMQYYIYNKTRQGREKGGSR